MVVLALMEKGKDEDNNDDGSLLDKNDVQDNDDDDDDDDVALADGARDERAGCAGGAATKST
jgi:hypothetical protein